MTTLAECTDVIHRLWPLEGAEEWDAPGLTVGDRNWPVRRILIAVDAVDATVSEALAGSYDLLVTHHPLLMRGVSSVSTEQYKGSLVTRLIQGSCALLSAHTNADVVESGATSVIARALGLTELAVIAPTSSEAIGIGRVGTLVSPITLGNLARSLADLLPATAGGVRVAGDWNQTVRRIALCSGAGDSLLGHPEVQKSDVYVTSDLRHHPAQEAREQASISAGPALIDVSHWASEWMWCDVAAAELRNALPGVTVDVSDVRTDPWDFTVLPAERTE
ncbi:MAG: Nif3-like dinuclear metal center hexameric protein [Agromyces sp.]